MLEDILFEGKQVKSRVSTVEEGKQLAAKVEPNEKTEKVETKPNPTLEQRKSQVGETMFSGRYHFLLRDDKFWQNCEEPR